MDEEKLLELIGEKDIVRRARGANDTREKL
jgi:hypothetical protein